jgi:hypothetical protein
VFRRRRERRQFSEAIGAEIDRIGPQVQSTIASADEVMRSALEEVGALPGAAARCMNCRTAMQMRRVKEGRRWWTMWVCPQCRAMYRPAEFPEAARAAGWR